MSTTTVSESGNASNSVNTAALTNTAVNKVKSIAVVDAAYGTELNSATEYTYYVAEFNKNDSVTDAHKNNVKWAFWVDETQEQLANPHFVISAIGEKQDVENDFLLTSVNEDEEVKKQENYDSINDNGILSAVIEIAEVQIGSETKETAVLRVKYSKWLDGQLIKVEAFTKEDDLTLSSSNDFVASRKVKAASPEITEVYWTTRDGERIETTGYSEEIYMNMVSLGLQGQTIEAHILESDDNNPDNFSEQGDQIEWENNKFVIESRTFIRQFKVINKEQGKDAREEDVTSGDTLLKMSLTLDTESEDLELYLNVFNATELGLDDTLSYGNLTLTMENNIVDAYFAKITTESIALDEPLTLLKGKFDQNKKGDVDQHEKLEEGVIGQKIKLVAECDNLENDTEVIFQLFEKTALLTKADTALKVTQNDTEVDEVIAKVKDGYAVTEILLRPKEDSDFRQWRTLLKFDSLPSDRNETLIWITAKEKDGFEGNNFHKEEGVKIVSTNWHEPVDNPISTNYTQSGTTVTSYSKHWGLFGNTRNGASHAGLDLFAKTGDDIFACLDGTVVNRRWHSGYGNTVTIKVDNSAAFIAMKREYTLQYQAQGEKKKDNGFNENGNFYLFYAHLDSVKKFKYGEKVKAGQKLGETGRSGVTAGTRAPHLHFEIRSSSSLSNRTNPAFYVNYKGYSSQSQAEKDSQTNENTTNGKLIQVNGTGALDAINLISNP